MPIYKCLYMPIYIPCRVGLQTASMHCTHALGKKFDSATRLSKRLVVCGTVYGDMHLKDLLGSIARVGYSIPVSI